MKTVSINVMNLCVPCENRCRYCLLSYDGKVSGVDYKRSEAYAKRFYEWLKVNRPDLAFLFGFGYSMEHPDLLGAIDFCQSIGSATGEFLQFDGMKFRTEEELEALLQQLNVRHVGAAFPFADSLGGYAKLLRQLLLGHGAAQTQGFDSVRCMTPMEFHYAQTTEKLE